MKVWLGAVLTACIIGMAAGDAHAQAPCSFTTNPYTTEDEYACTVSGEAAGEPLLVDCRRASTFNGNGFDTERGCRLSAASGTVDVQRCTGQQVPYSSHETCRTNAFQQGYECTRSGSHGGDGWHFSSLTETRCHARIGRLGVKVDSICDERLVMGYESYEFTDSCTTTVTTPLARVKCTHDPVVPLDYFLDTTRYLLTTSPPQPDSETATPACSRA